MDKQLIVNAQYLRVKLVSCILILHKSDFYFLDGWKLSPTESGFWCEHSFLEVNIAFVCAYLMFFILNYFFDKIALSGSSVIPSERLCKLQ